LYLRNANENRPQAAEGKKERKGKTKEAMRKNPYPDK